MRNIIRLVLLHLIAVVLTVCSDPASEPPVPLPDPINESDKGLPARWADVTLRVIRQSYPGSPTYTSRCLGYVGLTMYESVVHGSTTHRSLAGQLNGLAALPLPDEAEYNWKLVLNAGQAAILRSLYPHTYEMAAIDELENLTIAEESVATPEDVVNRSVDYGQQVAAAIYEWSKSDGGHEGYNHNFDPEYEVPVGNGFWSAPTFGQSVSMLPLHPHWGENRTFVTDNNGLSVPQKAEYSMDPRSEYYRYFYDVYMKRKSLSEEEKRIAAWWADDPTQTSSPPGHSYNLATILVTYNKADIFTSAEVYAKVGMAVADAFINCWRCKYVYHSERPAPYIKQVIDRNYSQFWPEPPFPAFSSGHATQSAAAAIVMMSVFDNEQTFLDNTYASREPDFEGIQYRSRGYESIWATAVECARSRFLGGIHTEMDNKAGTDQGKIIGENVSALNWHK